MYGLTRASTTLIAAGVSGLLIWIATTINDHSTGGYWAVVGLIAGAGLVMALSQLLGAWTKWGVPRLSATFFLLRGHECYPSAGVRQTEILNPSARWSYLSRWYSRVRSTAAETI